MVFHGYTNKRHTLVNVSYAPSLDFNLYSLHDIQRTEANDQYDSCKWSPKKTSSPDCSAPHASSLSKVLYVKIFMYFKNAKSECLEAHGIPPAKSSSCVFMPISSCVPVIAAPVHTTIVPGSAQLPHVVAPAPPEAIHVCDSPARSPA